MKNLEQFKKNGLFVLLALMTRHLKINTALRASSQVGWATGVLNLKRFFRLFFTRFLMARNPIFGKNRISYSRSQTEFGNAFHDALRRVPGRSASMNGFPNKVCEPEKQEETHISSLTSYGRSGKIVGYSGCSI
ncbi:hypothetical protein QUF54_01570 [Candidatus Marithioploca araucensis]|uniref:Transposase n=1 Tax=Candidatus Marithioploca araucensis TaxID=70273 RepID=A0ABT7VQT1_9GAMM|nr:hypothetical protein [Candidatus Marithioploca araucensis]